MFLLALCFHSLTFSQSTMNYQTYKIHFAFGESTLTNNEIQNWKKFEAELPSDYRINELKAHTDTVSSKAFNLQLATKRLNSVKDFLKVDYKLVETVVGEQEAEKSENYNDAEFRIVEVRYLLTPTIVNEPIKEEVKPELTNTIESFIQDQSKDIYKFDLSVLFEPGTPNFLKSSYSELTELLAIMQNYPNLDIIIHGHVCCDSEPNLANSRASAVYSYLEKNQISKDRMKMVGHDNKDPKVWPERTEEDRIANRRVTIEFLKQ